MCKSMPSSSLQSTKRNFFIGSSFDGFRSLYAHGIGVDGRVSAILSITLIPVMRLRIASNKHSFATASLCCSTENSSFACRKFCRGGMQVALSLRNPVETQNSITTVEDYRNHELNECASSLGCREFRFLYPFHRAMWVL